MKKSLSVLQKRGLTAKERKQLYLKAADAIINNIQEVMFVCSCLSDIIGEDYVINNIHIDEYINPITLPEFFLFKEGFSLAWLSHGYLWDNHDMPENEINENKLTVLYLCAEMCK